MIKHEIVNQVRSCLWYTVCAKVWTQVREDANQQVDDKVLEQVRSSIWNQVTNQVRDPVWDRIKD